MGARYYIPLIGRFTGVDPVDFKEENTHSFNRYAYANNNPYKYVDPDGRQAEVNVFPNFDPMGYLKGLAVESIKFTAMAAGGAGGAAEKVVAGSVAAKGIAAADLQPRHRCLPWDRTRRNRDVAESEMVCPCGRI